MTAIIILIILLLVYAELIRPNLPKRDITPLMGRDYAHRGYWNTNDPGEENRPENSLAGFRAAVEKDYGIELDVHLTKDGHLVVHHDDSLKRLTGVDIRIADSTLEEVRACKLPNGEPVPTYDEVLDTVAGRIPMIVEVKVENRNHDALSKAVYERMQRYEGPWCMESFDPRAVKWFRMNAPEIIRASWPSILQARAKTSRNGRGICTSPPCFKTSWPALTSSPSAPPASSGTACPSICCG